ncbi:MAG: PrsW family intramembrane metalloprotease [Saprospiraceae bacterium]|uniref:Protease PrsW n=1 Tax=Candidatus Opimibacter skivensis TaxID=2982028 RepID=A0A9D7SVQ0_9BACT|nr:PrsW family intramembrane metalloprotease [Candidatus Opimibacter skivensis]
MSTTLSMLIAVLPGIIIAVYFYLRDLREPEPSGLLLMSLLFGAVSFFISRGIGYLLHHFLYVSHQDELNEILSAFVFIGLLGEGGKFLFLRGITFYYKAFNQPFDGIVYAIMVGMGYATAENVFYVISSGVNADALRMFTSVPLNAVCAVIMGYFLGEAKLFRSRIFLYSLLALLLAAIVHGYYDYFLQMVYIKALWMQGIISVLIVIVLSQLAIKRRKAENLKKFDQ